MGEQKKSAKAGRAAGSKSAINYKASGKRYTNKLRKVLRHIKRCKDANAKRWLEGAMKIFSIDYKRGTEVVRKLHASIYGITH